jgi:hypothetical protein
MHMMQYSRPVTYNAVCDLARHMTSATEVHMDAMLRLIKKRGQYKRQRLGA